MSAFPRLDAATRQKFVDADAALVGRPMNLAENCVPALQANARHMALMLLDGPSPDRASQVAAFAESLIDASIAAGIAEPIACGKGCAHCCTTFVSCTFPEVFRLAQGVRGRAAAEGRVRAAAVRARSMDQYRREIDRVSCPILEDSACSAYVQRPVVCRAVLSVSLPRCLEIFRDGRRADFLYPMGAETIRGYVVMMMRAALIAAGMPHQNYEMTHALEIVLGDETAEARWLAGEPVFAGVAIDRAELGSNHFSELATALASVVRRTI